VTRRKHVPKPLRPRHAAGQLNIATEDLPDLGRPWTRDDVRALRDERPEWLTEARRRFAAAAAARYAAEREAALELSRRIEEAGWVTAADGSDQAIALYDKIALRAHYAWGVDTDLAYAAADILLPKTSAWHNDDADAVE
jgi:hypothetical protein